jgi:hypothetical protein
MASTKVGDIFTKHHNHWSLVPFLCGEQHIQEILRRPDANHGWLFLGKCYSSSSRDLPSFVQHRHPPTAFPIILIPFNFCLMVQRELKGPGSAISTQAVLSAIMHIQKIHTSFY